MKKLYVSKDEKGRYITNAGTWSKDINNSYQFGTKSDAKTDSEKPIRVNIVEATEE